MEMLIMSFLISSIAVNWRTKASCAGFWVVLNNPEAYFFFVEFGKSF